MDTPSRKLEINTVWKYQHVSFGIIAVVKGAYLSENHYFHFNIDEMALEKGNAHWKQMATESKVESEAAAIYLNIWTSVPDQTEARCQLEMTKCSRLFPEMIISASNLVQPFWIFSRIYSLHSSGVDLKKRQYFYFNLLLSESGLCFLQEYPAYDDLEHCSWLENPVIMF